MMRRLLQRISDWYVTGRTQAAIAERECKHDGSEPMCDFCCRKYSGGW